MALALGEVVLIRGTLVVSAPDAGRDTCYTEHSQEAPGRQKGPRAVRSSRGSGCPDVLLCFCGVLGLTGEFRLLLPGFGQQSPGSFRARRFPYVEP